MLALPRRLKEPQQLLLAVDLGQLAGALAPHPQIEAGLAQHVAIEEADGCRVAVAGTRGQVAFDQQVMEIGPDLFELELVGRAPVELGQPGHGRDIGLDGTWRQLAQLHLADQTLTEWGHRWLLDSGSGSNSWLSASRFPQEPPISYRLRDETRSGTTAERFSSNQRLAPWVFFMWILTQGAINPPVVRSANALPCAGFSHPPSV
jgi:hypothetical protein